MFVKNFDDAGTVTSCFIRKELVNLKNRQKEVLRKWGWGDNKEVLDKGRM